MHVTFELITVDEEIKYTIWKWKMKRKSFQRRNTGFLFINHIHDVSFHLQKIKKKKKEKE